MPTAMHTTPRFHLFPSSVRTAALLAFGGWLALAGGTAQAERADRNQPMEVLSDGKQAAKVDLARKITLITGHVNITQGTLKINADQVEVREAESGKFFVTATSGVDLPLTNFRQKRDRPDEYVEGEAERVEYDGVAETVTFIGAARLRELRGGVPTKDSSASRIIYNQRLDTFVFEGGSAQASPGLVPGKARLVFVPRSEPAASAPAGATPGAGK